METIVVERTVAEFGGEQSAGVQDLGVVKVGGGVQVKRQGGGLVAGAVAASALVNRGWECGGQERADAVPGRTGRSGPWRRDAVYA